MRVGVTTQRGFSSTAPARLLERACADGTERSYDIHPDGERFIVLEEVAEETVDPTARLALVQNWFQELERLVPTNE